MKILKTNDFVLERIQVKPITNAELEQISKKVKRIMNSMKLSPDMVKLITDKLTSGYPLKKQKYIKPAKVSEEISKFGACYDSRDLHIKNIDDFVAVANKYGMYWLNWNIEVSKIFGSGTRKENRQVLLTIDKTNNDIYVLHGKDAKWTLEDRIPGELYMNKL